jgi:CelD/BcsL family acetyltransferase involved in cellulose biosynthesis
MQGHITRQGLMRDTKNKSWGLDKSTSSGNGAVVETFCSFDELVAIQQEWDDFMESIGAEVFLTFDWCKVWWSYYGKNRELYIFIFRNNNKEICGILPMFIEHLWIGPIIVKVFKILGTDFTPIAVAIPIRPDSFFEVMCSFFKEINSAEYRWDLIHLGPICGRYESFEMLREACRITSESNYQIRFNENGVQMYIRLAGNWNDQLASLSKKHRNEMKRKYDRLLRDGFALECVDANAENFLQVFEEFVNTHQFHWNSLGKPGHFRAWPLACEFHREIAAIQLRLGRLRFYQIMLNGNCIGYRYAYKFGDTYYCFLYARNAMKQSDKIDFARIEFGETVKRGLADKVNWLDLMRGEYHHKIQLGGQQLPIRNIYIYNGWFPSFVRAHIFQLLAWVLNICYYKIWRARFAPSIGFKLGRFWELWIKSYTLSL